MRQVERLLGIVIIILAVLAGTVPFLVNAWPVAAQDEDFQMAPINPAALEPPSPYGYIPPMVDLSHLQDNPAELYMSLGDVPTEPAWDWRGQGKVTPVKDQKPCGTCWVFGTTSVLESAVLLEESAAYDFSEQSVALCVDRSWVYLYDDSDEPCGTVAGHGGGNSFMASEVFIKKGAVLETCSPYNGSALQCDGSCTCDSCPSVKKVTGYRYVTGDLSQTDLIKTAVYDHGPVTMAFYSSSGFYEDPDGSDYDNIYDYYDCPYNPDHLVSIIGWDDNVPHPDPSHSGTGAWLVKNSWGTGWGNSGCFWLAYNSSSMSEIAYLEYEDYDPDEVLYYWDEAGRVSSVGAGSSTCWMASVFASTQNGALTHVDFWTPSNDATYEIYVYDDDDPTDGLDSLLTSQPGSCNEAGYYSIPLDTPVTVTNGQQFTVAVEMTTPGYNFPLPMEFRMSDVGIDDYCEPTIQEGVSFISTDGSSWYDAYYEDVTAGSYTIDGFNVCLRARTTSTTTNNPPNAPASPLCEGVTNPTGVTDPTPEFSWTFSDPDGSDTQGAYQILVASSSGNLGSDIGDMWDSGKVDDSASEDSYRGATLADNQTYYWKVKTWDNSDAEGTYCGKQQFTTGTSPSEVWVDDDWAGSSHGDPVDGHTFGTDAFATIQDGIDAVAGSTVHVAAGTYYENITLKDGVEVLGAGAGVTTIDGGGNGSVVTAVGVGSTTKLDGFTITNGSATYGGGMYNKDSSPTVTDCTFSGNSAGTDGGGMYNWDSSPTVTNCTFTGNSASSGGGMCNYYNSSPEVTNCTFTGNSVIGDGGGMYNINSSSPTVVNCTFMGNSAEYGGGMHNQWESSPAVTDCTFTGNSADYGGGMYNNESSPAVTNCTFSGNSAVYFGGGMCNAENSSPTVTNCTFTGNSATDHDGGGMLNSHDSSPTVTGCTFSDNSAADYGGGMGNRYLSLSEVTNCTFSGNSADYGGGMYNKDSSPTVTNCTFWGNSVISGGGGMYNIEDSSPEVTNCVLWDGGDEVYNDGTSVPVVTYCDIEGGYTGTGNVDTDPLFVAPGAGDYHLQSGSPCIDTGDNSAPSLPGTDFEGDPRIMDGDGDTVAVVDMGVDEHGPPNHPPTAPVVDVTPDAPSTSDDLVCTIVTPSIDDDGDDISYFYEWYKDDVSQGLTEATVSLTYTSDGEVWKCVVTPYDGNDYGPTAEDEVAIGVPVLSSGMVTPASGYTTVTFTYSAVYADGDNDAPASITVTIDDGTPVGMTEQDPEDTDCTDGKLYEYSIKGTDLGKGGHEFQFAASDGTYDAIGDTDVHTGPTVKKRSGGGGGGGAAPDITPPRISEISSAGITKVSVDIYWKTQELSTSQVEYWASPHQFSELDETMVVEHHVRLTGLNPATTYHYKTMSQDAAGNLAVSEELTFTTLGEPATFVLSELAASPAEVGIGETVTISVLVSNTGDATGTYRAVLELDGVEATSQEVTLAGGASQTVTFTMSWDVAGSYQIGIGDLTCSFVVSAPVPTPEIQPAPVQPTPATTAPTEGISWWLIGGVIAGVCVAAGLLAYFLVWRKRGSSGPA